jgi:hypothetical protein
MKNRRKMAYNGDFVVFHRVAISESHLGKGLKLLGSYTFAKQQHLQPESRY